MKILLVVLVVVSGLVYAVWQFVRPPDLAAVVAQANAAAATTVAPSAVPSGASTITPAPTAPVAAPTVTRRATTAPVVVALKSALAAEFEKAKDLKPFYDRYAANPDTATPELKYFAATAIETCAGRTRGFGGRPGGPGGGFAGGPGAGGAAATETERAKFQARLKENDPINDQRVAAFERVNQLCEGFQSLNLTNADATKLFREAAAGGNPGARVVVAAEDYREQTRQARGVEERRLSEDQLATLRDSLASGDPFAIQRAGALLNWQSTQLAERRVGPGGDAFNPRDFAPAWTLAACDRGANCGADAARVLTGCAQQGACGYTNLETYMQYNELAPNVYANAQQYRAMIAEAITQGRWDWLGIQAGAGRTVPIPPPETRTPAKPGSPAQPAVPRKPG